MLGLPLVRGMKRAGLKYEDGTMLDPRDGKIYRAVMTLSPDGADVDLARLSRDSALGKDEVWQRLPDSAFAQVDPRGARQIHAGAKAAAEGQGEEQESPR